MSRLLALDLGERRIGVAVSDPIGIIARPLKTIVRGSRQQDFESIADLVKEYSAECVIVGLPLSLGGDEGIQARSTRRYAEQLAEALSIAVEFWDERYSSLQAAEILKAAGKSGKNAHAEVDAVAAAVILQSYLDSTRSLTGR